MTEIITKAIVGKSKTSGSEKFILEPSIEPDTILGCWIINHKVISKLDLDKKEINLDGSFDVNIWYSYNNNIQTIVFTKKIEYKEVLEFFLNENITNDKLDTIVNCYENPIASDVKILEDKKIQIYISKGIEIEVVGEVKIKVEEEED